MPSSTSVGSARADTVYSTFSGGEWRSDTTWIGAAVPDNFDDVIIQGPVAVGDDGVSGAVTTYCNNLTIETSGSLVNIPNYSGFGQYPLVVQGDCINRGRVSDNTIGDALIVGIVGDVYNDSLWYPYQTHLIGLGDQHLYLSPGKTFGSQISTNGSDLTALSDLVFTCDYNIGSNMYAGDFDLSSSTLHMGNFALEARGTRILNGDVEGDFCIEGIFSVWEDPTHPLVFEGNVFVTDTLQSDNYGAGSHTYTLELVGNLINNGLIRNINSGDRLSIEITGNIHNNGLWQHGYTKFSGTAVQYIEQAADKVFEGVFEDLDSLSAVVANSDLVFSDNFNLQRTHLKMNGRVMSIDGWLTNGYLVGARLSGGFLQNVTTLDSLFVYNTVTCDEPNLFTGTVTVMDTLRCNEYGAGAHVFELEIDGDMINNGLVCNFNSGDRLSIETTGDILNNGLWTNYATTLCGTADQLIKLVDGQPIDGGVMFDANYGSSPYQWYHDGTLLESVDFSGETSQVLTWNIPVQPSWYGTFHCETGSGPSRNIMVGEQEPLPVSGDVVGGDFMMQWAAWPGAANYQIHGTDNKPHFAPGSGNLLAVVPAGTTSWSSPNGVGDPAHNWTYVLVAVDVLDQELVTSDPVGEVDFLLGNQP